MLKKFLFGLPFTLAGLVSNAQTILENKTVNAVPATHLDFDGINDYVNCGNPRSRANPFAWFYNLKY